MRGLWNRFSSGWCRTFHPKPCWPAHGHYHCPACRRIYPVPWQEGEDYLRRTVTRTGAGNSRPGFYGISSVPSGTSLGASPTIPYYYVILPWPEFPGPPGDYDDPLGKKPV
jgi:hypothetical protein